MHSVEASQIHANQAMLVKVVMLAKRVVCHLSVRIDGVTLFRTFCADTDPLMPFRSYSLWFHGHA